MCVLLLIIGVIVGAGWVASRGISQIPSFVRKIRGLPAGLHYWLVEIHQNQVFVIDGYGNKVDITGKLNLDPTPPFYVARIDPDTEQVVEEFTSKHFRAIAISAERENRPDSWLAEEFDYWVIDEQSKIAYALKPIRQDEWGIERYAGVYVIDINTRQVKKFLEISPVSFTLALHPNREKLYVMTRPKKAEVETGEIRIYSTASLDLLKMITYLGGFCILDAEFNQDGSRLFCSVRGRGILVIDTVNDQLEHWEPPFDHPVDFGIEDRLIIRLTLNPDGQEIYVALREGEARGAVAAIDTIQKKLVRILDLSPTACTSVTVVGDKLFAACLDGVYVIDIPAWRKQQ
jgi:hypothetical protein